MGNSSSKVGLMSEPPTKRGYFRFMKVKSNKNKDFDKEFCKYQKQSHLRSGCSNERSKKPETRNKNTNKCEEKFRTRFDPRITARYDIKALIGRGSFSHVVRVEHRYTHQPFAIKLLEVREHKGRDSCQVELGILRRVHHANIIRLVEVFETPHRVYLVLELATGGELLDRVLSRGSFTERDATKALIMVSRGLSYIHALGVIHRDLKPENLLYYHPGQDSRLIITDFGLACWSRKSQMVDHDDVVTGGSCVAGTGEDIAGCARSDREDDGGADDADSCDIIDRKAKGADDNCRLVDDGKARDESSQRTVVAIRGDGRKDTNWISTGDEREIDKSLRFEGMERGSDGVVDEMTITPKFSEGTKRTQNACIEESKTDGLEAYKHTNFNMAEGKEVTQNIQMQFSHDKLKERRQNYCVKSRRDRAARGHDKSTKLHCKVKEYSNISSEGQKSHDWALRTLCGTPEYLAPEMVAGRTYGCEVDMWALGVISYIVLSGSMPFEQRSRPRLFTAILRGSFSFHGQPWSSISHQAKDFIERLLSVNPEQRMTAEQALKHPWLLNMASCSSNTNLHRPISRNLRQRASRISNYSSSSHSVPESRSVVTSRSQSRPDSRQLPSIRAQHSVAVSA
ncbi:serine/threonine-protein kinase H1 homolog [Pangasianodon hypophthalmus]|uniref:serine/threonine-protein kinase H1 homolog n=1 Tax=Pangasianodon hypophthalmus TaxID=310915 RepID=UPI002307D30D|nr:serine/threonine-protein kinase H1 homolog [Pangasianodon hypophthalmus]